MLLTQQVCTLQQAKRLMELGVSGPCVWVYFKADNHSGLVLGSMYMRHIWIVTGVAYEDQDVNITPAFTVAELGQMLPSETYTMRQGSEDSEYANWEWVNDNHNAAFGLFATEAEARAAHLIYLLESDFIDASDCNKRLANG